MATIRGTSGTDTLIGDDPIDIIYGYGGNDFLYGSDGRDTLYGGDGDDFLRTKGDSEVLYGGMGADYVYVSDPYNTAIDLRLTGFQRIGWGDTGLVRMASIERIATSSGNDSLNGNDLDNSFSSDYGNDTVYGHGGMDSIFTSWGNDRGYGGQGNDLLAGGWGNDTLYGGAGADLVEGQGGSDRLIGGLGSDRLEGGTELDRDYFIFTAVADSRSGVLGRDTIRFFQRNLDKLDFRQIDANSALSGDQAFSFTGTTATAKSVWYKVSNGHTSVFADTTGDRIADMEIQLLGVNGLSATDFLL